MIYSRLTPLVVKICVNWDSRKTVAYAFTRAPCQNEQNMNKKIKIWHVKFRCSKLKQVSKEKTENSGWDQGTQEAWIRKVALGAWWRNENIARAQESVELTPRHDYQNTDRWDCNTMKPNHGIIFCWGLCYCAARSEFWIVYAWKSFRQIRPLATHIRIWHYKLTLIVRDCRTLFRLNFPCHMETGGRRRQVFGLCLQGL